MPYITESIIFSVAIISYQRVVLDLEKSIQARNNLIEDVYRQNARSKKLILDAGFTFDSCLKSKVSGIDC